MALGSRLAAELYDCEVLEPDVEDHADNATRFVWLAPVGAVGDPDPEGAKTSVVFWGGGDMSPGWLVGVLGEFAGRGVNLTRIESRPRRIRLGHYMFFADLEGSAEPAAGERGAGGPPRPRRGGARSRFVHRDRRRALAKMLRTVGASADLTFTTEAGDTEPGPAIALPAPGRGAQRGGSSGRVLVLNASFEPINVCTVRRAAVLLLKNRAEILERERVAAARRVAHASQAGGDPAAHLRPHPARRPPAQDHPTRGVRPRPLDLPVLRARAGQPDRRPRDPPLEGRRARAGTTSSPAARPATAARATACPGRPG